MSTKLKDSLLCNFLNKQQTWINHIEKKNTPFTSQVMSKDKLNPLIR